MPPRILLGLVLFNLAWSFNPTAAKWALESCGPASCAFLRNGMALLGYLAFRAALARLAPTTDASLGLRFARPGALGGRGMAALFAMGFLTFAYSPLVSLQGLTTARAGDAALIVAIEPLMTAFLAWVFLGERGSGRLAVCFILALSGFWLISGGFGSPAALGNLGILASLLGEASFGVLGKRLLASHRPGEIFGSALAIGTGLLALPMAVEVAASGAIRGPWTATAIGGILWLAWIGTAGGYLFWLMAVQSVPLMVAALTLFIQPVFGLGWGTILFSEDLAGGRLLGAALVLLGLLVGTVRKTS